MENQPQMPSQLTSNQGQYPPPSYQEFLPPAQDYPQTPPNQFYQHRSLQPNQELTLAPQPTRLQHVSRKNRELIIAFLGVLLVVVGIMLSTISYSLASSAVNNGGTGNYIIFTGPIIIGTICAITGFFRWILVR
jgi:uncharacterized membrane protein